ncbi:QRFP-like peptide receptor [Diorhabda sublineata]|uniref:QRFP-like peptide receptor n=1 Tax=Diorhabda sublineata TaxID=1163346 RepID=UPI0024E0BF2F|nr:QRFP-like peptide receptor [Diorhabda sublineata]
MNDSNGTNFEIDVNRLLEEFNNNDYVLIGIYIPVFLTALGANLLFIIVISKIRIKRTSNYFLLNLSTADLFVTLICMPNAMWRAYTTLYSFDRYSCKIIAYVECIAVATSILTITAMAMHRYFAITKPLMGLLYPPFDKRGCLVNISGIWTISMVVFCPVLWVYDLEVENIPLPDRNISVYLCLENWDDFFISRHVLGIIWFTFIFLIPGLIMTFTYTTMGRTLCAINELYDDSRYQAGNVIVKRRRVAYVLFLLAAIFAICWLPIHVWMLVTDLKSVSSDDESTDKFTQQKSRYLLLLGHWNSALNPLVYFTLSRKLRKSIQELFRRTTCEGQRETSKVTLIKLNTLNRNLPLQNSKSTTQNTKKNEEI